MQPVREVEEAVVHREDEVGDQAGYREGPALELDAFDGDHLSASQPPLSRWKRHIVLEAQADKPFLRLRLVQPAHLERDETGLAEIDGLLELTLGQVPEVQPAAIAAGRTSSRSKPFS